MAEPSWKTDDAGVEALVAGHHDDPFRRLGLHREGRQWIVRTVVPGAESVEAIDADGKSVGRLERRHAAGFFEGPVKIKDRQALRYLAANGQGTWTVLDAYLFGPVLGPLDDYYMAEGNHLRLYDKLGAHPIRHEGHDGVHFAVWAPNASRVSVVGDFNQWHTVKDGVLARVAGRLPVLARLQMLMEGIVAGLTRGDAFMAQGKLPLGDRGMSLVEAASDVLGHWLRIENGCIANYQIIALTTWNFSLRPARGQSDPLEGAKVAEGETAAPTIPHIVHSFDPCAVFTVH